MSHIARGAEPCNVIGPPIDIGTLEAIANWRVELSDKIKRARLRFELIGLDESEQTLLAAEVQEFKRVCRAVMRRRTNG